MSALCQLILFDLTPEMMSCTLQLVESALRSKSISRNVVNQMVIARNVAPGTARLAARRDVVTALTTHLKVRSRL